MRSYDPNPSPLPCHSPFPPIPPPPYDPLPEFVSSEWGGSKTKDKVAIFDGFTGQDRTFAEYHASTGSMAAALKHELGVTEDSVVALFSPNHVDYVPICLSVATLGAKLTPINPLYTQRELSDILKRSRTQVLITHAHLKDVALAAAQENPTVKHVVTIPHMDGSDVPEGTINLNSLKNHGHSPIKTTSDVVKCNMASHPYLLPYSSGTTGLPKAVCLSHQNLVANLQQMNEAEALAFPCDHRLISPLPFFHIYGFLATALYCAWRGQEVITMSGRFDLELFCKLVEEHKPHRAHLVPPIILGLAKHPMIDNFDMSSLNMIISAAAPLGADVEQEVCQRLDCGVKQAWGMSELSPIGTFTSDYNIKSGSIGPLAASTYGKIIDIETGRSLGPNEEGELVIKGPQVMLGYLDAADKTAECLSKDGWLRTGDVARYDEDGFFYITDRLKELIKVRGYQVAPAELEALLLTNEHVKDAAVIPVLDEASGELPRAYVVLKDTEEAGTKTEHEIEEWVKERVAPYKRLAGGVIFTDEIPKSASGKILRRLLVDQDRHGVTTDED